MKLRMHRPRLLCAALLAAIAAPALADDQATSTPQQVQALPEPPMAAARQDSFVLQSVEFVGATGVPAEDLQEAAAPYIGKSVTFADLEAIAARATAIYAQRGFALTQAYVPVQEVVDGRVQIAVAEATLGNISIDVAADAPIDRERVARTLAILEPGQPLNGRRYERAMLLLSDLPGIRPQSVVSAGSQSGTTDLAVEVARVDPLKWAVELDNFGTGASGRHRLTGTMRWASPSGRGDNLDARLMLAQGMHTAFGRLGYETPVGYSGLRVGGGIARVQYELGGPFAALEPTGTGNVADLSFSYPLVRQRAMNLFFRGIFDHKSLTDRFEAVGFEARKRISGGGLGLALERRDGLLGGGYTSATGMLYHGRLSLRDETSRAFDAPPIGYGTAGGFTKLTLQGARLQYIAPRLSLFVGAGLQRASKNLDAYEKLSLGGPRAVRAYPAGEVLVDDGWVANVELRLGFTAEITGLVFYDAADGDFFHDPRPLDPVNSRALRGYGLGFNWTRPGNVAVNLSLAWSDTGPALTDGDDRDPRLFWSIQKSF